MAPANLTRRRMIAIAAATAGSAFLSGGTTRRRGRGRCAGADRRSARRCRSTSIHPDRAEAERVVQICMPDVRRLEQQFSLYRADSAICTLNRSGILVAPDARHGRAAQGLAAVLRPYRRRVRSDRPAAVAALRRAFLFGEAGSAKVRRPRSWRKRWRKWVAAACA